MSTTYVTDPAESGELPRPGERTLNLAPYVISPPTLRRPEATELPIIVDVADRQQHDEPTPYVGRHRRRSWPHRLLAAIVGAYAGTVAR